MWAWLTAHGKTAVWVRRSRAFKGWFIHFGTMRILRGRILLIEEYVPLKGRRWTRDDLVLCFRGKFRVSVCRVEKIRSFDSQQELDDWVSKLSAPSSEP